jgi:hypothetical protein
VSGQSLPTRPFPSVQLTARWPGLHERRQRRVRRDVVATTWSTVTTSLVVPRARRSGTRRRPSP